MRETSARNSATAIVIRHPPHCRDLFIRTLKQRLGFTAVSHRFPGVRIGSGQDVNAGLIHLLTLQELIELCPRRRHCPSGNVSRCASRGCVCRRRSLPRGSARPSGRRARRTPRRAAPIQGAWRPDSVESPPGGPRGARDEGGPSEKAASCSAGAPEHRRAGRVATRRQPPAAVGDERSEERHDHVHQRHCDHTARPRDDRRSDHDDH